MHNITITLEQDIDNILLQRLRNAGFIIPKKLNISGTECFINMKHRFIEPRPRNIHLPQQIQIPNEHLNGIRLILNKMKRGHNINAHQSRHIKNIGFQDAFLQDFGFHHFHLGETHQTGKNKDLIARTGYEIIAKVNSADIYIIGVYNHSKEEGCILWGKTELLDICYDNWPHLLEPFILRRMLVGDHETSEVADGITEADRIKMRQARINVPIRLKCGTLIMSPGGGFTGNGTSINMRHSIMKLMDKLHLFKKTIVELSKNLPGNCHFKVVSFDDDYLCISEEKHRIVILAKNVENRIVVTTFNFGPGMIKFAPPKRAQLNTTTEILSNTFAINTPHYLSPFPSIIYCP